MQLKRKLTDLNSQIRSLTQVHKMLVIDKAKRERRLDKIIQQGEPEGMKQVTIQQNNLDTLIDR